MLINGQKAFFCYGKELKIFDENEVLIQSAANLFGNKGYNGTSMQDLVDGLGISRSSLYDTYGDKHTLLLMKALESYQLEWHRHTMHDAIYGFNNSAPTAKDCYKKIASNLLYTYELLGDCTQHKGCFMTNAAVEVAPHDADVNNMSLPKNDQQIEDALLYQAIKKGPG